MNEPFLPGSPRAATRRATNVSLDPGHLAAARALGINISQACEQGLVQEIERVRQERWLAENKAALESSNAFAEASGLPLANRRLF